MNHHENHRTSAPGEAAVRAAPSHAGHGAHQGDESHDKHAGHSVEMFRQKFRGTLLLSIPTDRPDGREDDAGSRQIAAASTAA